MHPEKGKVVVANDIAAANALDADWISVKNAHRVLVWLKHSGTNDTDLVLKLQEATAVAGTSSADIAVTMPIYADTDAGTGSDTMAKQTDAATFTIDPATQGSTLVCFDVDPARVLSDGFDCIRIAATGGHGSNNVFAWYEIETRYRGPVASMPSAITD
ncbi:MAG: hypothetical protein WC277_10455 [Bacilli bacterium]|jgi:hypothetical protein